MLKRSVVSTTVESASNPSAIIDGAKTNISNVAAQLSSSSVAIKKGIAVRCRSLGTGTYIAIGNATTQNLRFFTAVGDTVFIDWIDNISKIYVITDVGNTGALEYNGG